MRMTHLVDARHRINWAAIDLADHLTQVTGRPVSETHIFAVERGRYRCKPALAAAWAEALGLPPATAFPEIFQVPAVDEVQP